MMIGETLVRIGEIIDLKTAPYFVLTLVFFKGILI